MVSIALCLSGCAEAPDGFPLPAQRAPLPEFRSYRQAYVVDMVDAEAEQHIVSDIFGPPGAKWRWTGKRPTLRIAFGEKLSLDFMMDLVFADLALKDTGPVTVTFHINGHTLASVVYSQSGEHHFEKAIPEEWLERGKEAVLSAEIDKMWREPGRDIDFGMIVESAGLRER